MKPPINRTQLTPEQVVKESKKFTIGLGGHSEYMVNQGHIACIMETVNYIVSGGVDYSASPPCVSGVVTDQLIALNDSLNSDRSRARLRAIIPDVLDTAPLTTRKIWGKLGMTELEVCTHEGDHDYREAERRRIDMVDDLIGSERAEGENAEALYVSDNRNTIEARLEFIKKLAAIKKFDNSHIFSCGTAEDA